MSRLWLGRRLHTALNQERPDLIHVVAEPWGALSVQATLWSFLHPSVSLVVHGCETIWWHGSFFRKVAKRVLTWATLSRCDGYAAESERAVSQAHKRFPKSRIASSLIHTNPRDPDLFRPPSLAERQEARKTLGLPKQGIGIGFLGRLVPEKGPSLFLDAIEDVLKRSSPGTWAVVAGDGPIAESVKKKSEALGVKFLGKLPYPLGVRNFHQSINVCCVPSFSTPFWEDQSPRTLIEAMLSGATVVGSSSGAIPEMIDDTGFIFPERNVDEMIRALMEGIDEAVNNSRGAAARERAARLFGSGATAEALLKFWGNAHKNRTRRD